MTRIPNGMTVAMALVLLAGAAGAAGPPSAPLKRCPADSVVAGAGCMDKFEASVWRVPATNRALVARIQQGKATAAELTAGGATQLGIGHSDNYAPCADSGQNCTDDIYAVSLSAVSPSANITWFQAQAACENAGKRLPSNAEWQAAVTGTPDPGTDDGMSDCNTASAFAAVPTGSRSSCKSARGAFDMVGNLYEWVADWVPRATGCGTWSPGVSPTGDDQCLAGAETTGEPAALVRGGSFINGSLAGPLAVLGSVPPSLPSISIGFRCTR
jgi:formylglycine-generating enzyme required for sulfatase activity